MYYQAQLILKTKDESGSLRNSSFSSFFDWNTSFDKKLNMTSAKAIPNTQIMAENFSRIVQPTKIDIALVSVFGKVLRRFLDVVVEVVSFGNKPFVLEVLFDLGESVGSSGRQSKSHNRYNNLNEKQQKSMKNFLSCKSLQKLLETLYLTNN